ncbi:hypothetical protein N8094_00230 [Flavobacteriaceae bacterium]|nr:hypothetical protein [Flavobacteriaceae bacterium]
MELKIANTEKTVVEGMEEIKNFLMDPTTEQTELPLKHSFAPGVYAREMEIPAGTLLIGKIHKHRHHNFLMKGSIIVLTETNGVELLQAPLMIVSEEGTQRIGYAVTDTVWTTIHENKDNSEDLDVIENRTVVKTKAKYIEYKKKLIKNITI